MFAALDAKILTQPTLTPGNDHVRGDSAVPRTQWDPSRVSFDVFFQGFSNGEASPGGGSLMRAVLAPYIKREEPEHGFLMVEIGDGSADLYLDDDDMMANHISGRDPWDPLVQGAEAAGWVIMPVGCPTCLTRDDQVRDLPDPLRDAVAVVRSGADLVQVIESA